MRKIVGAIFLVVLVISLIVFAFTINQVDQEKARLTTDLQYRSTLLAESLRDAVEPNFVGKSDEYLQDIVERFANRERLAGLAVFDNKGNITAISSSVPKKISESQEIVSAAMDEDKASGDFVKLNEKNFYGFAIPLHDEKSVVGSLMLVQNADYIDSRLTEIWKNNLMRLFIQASLLSIAILLIIRWIIYEPVRQLVESLKSIRSGSVKTSQELPSNPFLQPLVRELTSVTRSLSEARLSASEEARLRLTKLDSPWTAQRLKEFVKDVVKNKTIFLVSNREPYIHEKNGNKITSYQPASGMVTALEPVMNACGGLWIAHGSGSADKEVVDKNNKLKVPPDEPSYTLHRVWLTDKEEQGYYYGFSNEGLWPLCHNAHTRPIFRESDWKQYKVVNEKFAEVLLKEIKYVKNPIVLIQDFHLALLPRIIKNKRPEANIAIFWHIPWPSAEAISICPWKKELLDGILGADLIGFHTQHHCNNFIETVGRELESLIDFEQFSITRGSHSSYIKPFPISIALSKDDPKKITEIRRSYLKKLGVQTQFVGVGIDRLDYTKGILERLKAIEIFFHKNPTYKGRFTFIQAAAPSRSRIKRYKEFAEEVEKEVIRINNKLKTRNWKPIVYIKKHHSHEEVNKLYKSADVCLVTSLHDGMNLVAKEFVAARSDMKGVLILSQFTGASRELKDSLIVNPYNAVETAEAIQKALEMSESEQNKRMRRMRNMLKNYNIYRWSADLLKTISELGQPL